MNQTVALLAPADAARSLNVTTRTLERWRISGEGPKFVRVGPRKVGYRQADLQAWLDGRAFAHRAEEMSRRDVA